MNEEISILRDALDHIAKTCTQSRTQTRRLRWINCRANTALEGKPYDPKLIDLPTSGDKVIAKHRNLIEAQKEEIESLSRQLEDALNKLGEM